MHDFMVSDPTTDQRIARIIQRYQDSSSTLSSISKFPNFDIAADRNHTPEPSLSPKVPRKSRNYSPIKIKDQGLFKSNKTLEHTPLPYAKNRKPHKLKFYHNLAGPGDYNLPSLIGASVSKADAAHKASPSYTLCGRNKAPFISESYSKV